MKNLIMMTSIEPKKKKHYWNPMKRENNQNPINQFAEKFSPLKKSKKKNEINSLIIFIKCDVN